MRFSICNEIFQGWSMEQTARFAASTGYDAIEIAPFTLADRVTAVPQSERRKVRETVAASGLAISAIHWVLAKTSGLHLTHPDAAVRDRTSQYLCELVDFCSDLGSSTIVIGSPKQRDCLPGVAQEQAWDWATEVFRNAVGRASDQAVILCLEPLGTTETNFINTAAEAIRFIEEFNTPSLRIILDVKAMSSEAKPVPDIIRASWPHFAYFHANDPNLKGPGFGSTDFGPIAQALTDVGYHGYVSVEVFDFSDGPEAIATRSLACLKAAFSRTVK